MNAGFIIRGWLMRFGLIPTSNAEKKLSELRLKICHACPLAKDSEILKVINGSIGNATEKFCTKCTCPCLEKTLVVDEFCPIQNW